MHVNEQMFANLFAIVWRNIKEDKNFYHLARNPVKPTGGKTKERAIKTSARGVF